MLGPRIFSLLFCKDLTSGLTPREYGVGKLQASCNRSRTDEFEIRSKRSSNLIAGFADVDK